MNNKLCPRQEEKKSVYKLNKIKASSHTFFCKTLPSMYLIDLDDGGRWSIVDKLFPGNIWYTFHNKAQIQNFRYIYFEEDLPYDALI